MSSGVSRWSSSLRSSKAQGYDRNYPTHALELVLWKKVKSITYMETYVRSILTILQDAYCLLKFEVCQHLKKA